MSLRTHSFALLLLVAGLGASTVAAEARNYNPRRTTVPRLADLSEAIVVGTLDRVEDIALSEPGRDGAVYKRVGDGSVQDGDPMVRREAVIKVSETIRGEALVQAGEIRAVSMRQLKFDAYDADLRDGEAIWFLGKRQDDGRLIPIMDERGTVSAPECALLAEVADFVRWYLESAAGQDDPNARFGLSTEKLIQFITLDQTRMSVDATLEFSWNPETYGPYLGDAERAKLLALALESKSGTPERRELITCIGRYKPEGGFSALMELLRTDTDFGATSLASWSLEQIDRVGAVQALLDLFDSTESMTEKMLVMRSLSLIRPKDWYEGEELYNRTLAAVGSLLSTETPDDVLRETLIAARDIRAFNNPNDTLDAPLKALIDNRAQNGISQDALKGAILALAASRTTTVKPDGSFEFDVPSREYLEELAKADPALSQWVDASLKYPYTTLIVGADGRAR